MNYTEEQLDGCICLLSPLLLLPKRINAFCLLKAITGVESSFGNDCTPKFEKNYGPGGKIYEADTPGGKELRLMYQKWGSSAAHSYGPFQIMYSSCLQFGYSRLADPKNLQMAELSGSFVVKYINSKVARGCLSVEEIADAYNSGTSKDRRTFQVQEYVEKLQRIYDQLLKKHSTKIEKGDPYV